MSGNVFCNIPPLTLRDLRDIEQVPVGALAGFEAPMRGRVWAPNDSLVSYVILRSRELLIDGGEAGVMVTDAQCAFSREHGTQSWLYVVENALGSAPKLHRIRNFARRIWRYGFDAGWASVAEAADAVTDVLPKPEKGMHIRMRDQGVGEVIAVHERGRLIGVEVRLGDGSIRRCRWRQKELVLEPKGE